MHADTDPGLDSYLIQNLVIYHEKCQQQKTVNSDPNPDPVLDTQICGSYAYPDPQPCWQCSRVAVEAGQAS